MGSITGFLSTVPFDYIVLGGIVVVIGADSIRSGVGRACALAAALPIALLLYSLLGKALLIGTIAALTASAISQTITFGVIVVLAYLLVRRMGLEYLDGGMGEPIQAVLAGGAVAVVFAVVWLQLPALNSFWHFKPQISALFAESYRLWWLIGAYTALAFARG